MKTFLFIFLTLFWAFPIFGRSAELFVPDPQPPEVNPHPPQNLEDQRRVDFAVAEIKAQYGPDVEIQHPHVIPWSYEKFLRSRGSVQRISELPRSSRAKMRAPMPGPSLKPDEYMVHVYVRFPSDPRWHHLDVILTEDLSGNLARRGFFSFPMPNSPSKLPPGAVC